MRICAICPAQLWGPGTKCRFCRFAWSREAPKPRRLGRPPIIVKFAKAARKVREAPVVNPQRQKARAEQLQASAEAHAGAKLLREDERERQAKALRLALIRESATARQRLFIGLSNG